MAEDRSAHQDRIASRLSQLDNRLARHDHLKDEDFPFTSKVVQKGPLTQAVQDTSTPGAFTAQLQQRRGGTPESHPNSYVFLSFNYKS